MKPNDPYWQERFESLEASRHDKSVEKVREVVRNLSNAEKRSLPTLKCGMDAMPVSKAFRMRRLRKD